MVRNSREDWKTYQEVFDNFTQRLLFRLSSQHHFDEINNIVSPGKEAVVYSAKKGDSFVALKIYKLQTSKFGKMFDYIRVDPRYQRVQRNQRKVTFSWAEREFRNLILARKAGIAVPVPINHRDNVIVMEFIGHGDEAAPLLKYSVPENPKKFAEVCFRYIEQLAKAGYVHGDLSEYNIINHEEHPVFIDFSHTVPLTAPNSVELIRRDVETVAKYFSKIGVDIDVEKFLKKILTKSK